ncbi:MAG: tandem-95 repeat protein, partial [Verrucomicrobia bacterium]
MAGDVRERCKTSNAGQSQKRGKANPLQPLIAGGFFLVASSLSAAVAPGPDASGYTVLPTTNFAFSQIAFTTNQHVLWQGTDDQAFTVTNIGFAFPFYGTNYTNVSFNVNGLMTFGSPSMDPTNVNLTTTSPTNNQPCIAVLWDDWYSPLFGADGVYYKTTGTAGSRQFIVQWNKVIPVYGPGSDFVIFEVRFFEGSGNILCSYLDTVVSDDATNPPIATLGISATVGIRDTSGQSNGRNLQWSFNQGIVTNGLNLLFVPTNHVPVANADAVTLAEDSTATLNLLANDTDADGDVLKWTGFTQATNGIVTSNANGTVTYTPATNYFGADNFTYSIADGRGGSATGLVSIIVSPVNDVPTLNSLTNWALLEDAGTQIVYLTGISTGASNETDTLTVTVSSSDPAIIPAPTITYSSPDATGTLSFASATNAFGTVTITVTVNDGQASNNVVSRSFTVTITPMNDPPIAYDDSAATLENTPVTISPLLNDFDVEGDALTLLGADTTHGTVSILDETNLLFTPSSNFFGYATITYTNSDGHGGTASALVSVLVNDPPMLSHITDQTNDEDVVIGPLPFIMADRETPATNLLLVITSTNTLLLPTNQIVLAGSDTNRTLTLTPTTNLSGTTHVTLTLTDEFGATASDSFLVTVLPVNDAPFANDQTVTTPEDSATNLLLAATDVDSTNFIFAILTAPTNGVISGFDTNSGAFTYTP